MDISVATSENLENDKLLLGHLVRFNTNFPGRNFFAEEPVGLGFNEFDFVIDGESKQSCDLFAAVRFADVVFRHFRDRKTSRRGIFRFDEVAFIEFAFCADATPSNDANSDKDKTERAGHNDHDH